MVAANVARAIAEVAAEEKVGLIVASAHGSTAAEGAEFGSVTRGIMDRAGVPILALQDAPATRPYRLQETRPGRRRELRAGRPE